MSNFVEYTILGGGMAALCVWVYPGLAAFMNALSVLDGMY